MSEVLRAALRSTWRRNAAYALRLVGDIPPEHFVSQPAPGRTMNHPAWIFCHLNVYASIVASLLRGEPFEDPLGKPYARGSTVSPRLSDYPEPREVVAAFERLHDDAAGSLDTAGADRFSAATPVERLRTMSPTVGELLVMLMVKHESFHLGQLSAWRRAMGMAPVEM